MLNEVLTKIDSVLSLSIDVPAVASSVLDSLQRAYTYLHEITQARLVLGETSRKALDEFDAAFKRYLERKLNEEEEEQTSEELVKCEQLAGEETLMIMNYIYCATQKRQCKRLKESILS